MLRRIKQRVDLGDRHPRLTLLDLHDLVAGADLAFLEDAEVESGTPAGRQKRRHAGLVHANPDAIAGDPGLCDLEQSAADPIAIADVDAVVRQAFDREVLAKLAVNEVGPSELFLPVAVGLDLVDEDRAPRPSVPGEIALTVSVEVQLAHATARPQRFLPDARAHRPTPPHDVARLTDIDRQQSRHLSLSRAGPEPRASAMENPTQIAIAFDCSEGS